MARGADPEDAELFAEAYVPALRVAVAELSWLLAREYAEWSRPPMRACWTRAARGSTWSAT